ncbi:sulfotransferase 1C4 [Homalodisca vitripennis]|uniref:sulfotransferase 1C4 n=1 Tax=Homalodisca vitripennis TaxID=197043 RepID=UPI001EEA49DC|nr:sulfotransferase 1C4 [Homalodisca vitripennis]
MGDDHSAMPLEITPVEEELNRQLLSDFTGERTGFLRVGPQGYFLPSKYARQAHHLYNFQPRPDDVWVATFPRSGTTWTQELVWLIANNLDFETAGKVPQTERFPFFEFSLFLHDETKEEFIKENESDPKKVELVEQLSKPGYQILNEMTTRRFIKTHLPFSLLPKTLLEVGCKVVYVARNPKDVAVSFYHLNRLIRTQGYKGDFSKYWDYFERNLNPWTPYWSHVNEGWKLKSHPNVLFLFYEEMNKDIKSTINQVSEFLLGSRLSEKDTDRLANYLDITNFRSNPAVNYQPLREAGILVEGEQGFIRKGKNGGWVEEFTPELNKRADKWIHENLRQTDLRFPGMCDV